MKNKNLNYQLNFNFYLFNQEKRCKMPIKTMQIYILQENALQQMEYLIVKIQLLSNNIKQRWIIETKKDEENNNVIMIISGFVRTKGNADAALNKFLYEIKILSFYQINLLFLNNYNLI